MARYIIVISMYPNIKIKQDSSNDNYSRIFVGRLNESINVNIVKRTFENYGKVIDPMKNILKAILILCIMII